MQYLPVTKDPGIFEKATLKNGITVFYKQAEQTFGAPKIACSAVVMVGGRDDFSGKQGGAHFFEHMPFRGTKDFPSLAALTDKIENNGGYINAFTTDEATGYEIIVPATMMEAGVKRIADMLQNPIMREEEIELERQVILEELRNKLANVNFFARQELFKGLLGDHPIVHAVIGTEEALLSIKKEDLLALHNKYYNASNVALFFAGTFNPDELLANCEQYFGSMQPGESTVRNVTAGERTISDYQKVFTPEHYNRSVYLTGRVLPKTTIQENIYIRLFIDMLTRGMTSPLYSEIREKRGLAYNLGMSHSAFSDAGMLMFFVSTQFKHMDEVDKLFWEQINSILTNKARFNEVKHMYKQGMLHTEYSVSTLLDTAIDVYIDYREMVNLNDFIGMLDATTLEDTKKYIAPLLNNNEFLNIRVNTDDR